MRWSWRFYVALAFVLATSVAFMNVIGAAPKYDAATWWRLFFAWWLGQLAGTRPRSPVWPGRDPDRTPARLGAGRCRRSRARPSGCPALRVVVYLGRGLERRQHRRHDRRHGRAGQSCSP
jgi:hypothetical protein